MNEGVHELPHQVVPAVVPMKVDQEANLDFKLSDNRTQEKHKHNMTSIQMDTESLHEVAFGDDMGQKELCLRPQSVFLNHGSYGVVPRRVLDVQKRLMDERENHPDHWFRRVARGYWLEARTAAAEFVGADVDDVVFVSNATTAVNVVLRSLKLEAGDAILATTLTFRSFQTLWEDLQERIYPRGVQCLLMEIKMPILSEDQVVQQYDEFLASHPNVKFVLIDHITSPSTILMPVERLIPVCHKHGALVMIDGAHAPGQVKLKLNMLGADMYTGNFHKWLFTPRGCALLWVSKDHHHLVNPVNTPWRKKQSLGDQFFYQGTQDHIPLICAKYGVQFYQAIGGMERIIRYKSKLTTEGCDYLVKKLDLTSLAIPPSMESPNLRFLKLPRIPSGFGNKTNQVDVQCLEQDIYQNHDIQTIFDFLDGALYLRISVHIYNTMDDFVRLASVLKKYLDQ